MFVHHARDGLPNSIFATRCPSQHLDFGMHLLDVSFKLNIETMTSSAYYIRISSE